MNELITRLNDTRQIAANSLIKSKNRSKYYYDRKANTYPYKPGDLVYAIKEARKNKLDSTYMGLYKIANVLDKHNVVLEVDNHKRIVKHMDKIKPAHKRNKYISDGTDSDSN